MPPVIDAVRVLILVMVLVTVPFAAPHPGVGTRGIAIAVALGVSAIAWITMIRVQRRPTAYVATLAVMAAAGGTLAGLSSFSTAIAVGCVVTSSAGVRLSTDTSLALTAETVATFLIAGLATGQSSAALIGSPAAFIGLWAFALTRRAYLLRAEEAEEALEQTNRAHAAENQAAALAERAGSFTRNGLAEARRAILALRDGDGDGDGASPRSSPSPRPLADQLEALVAEHRADGDMTVDFGVTGQPHPVGAEAGLTAFRTAQEALTNARKHAPGQPVSLRLEFTPAGGVTVAVTNPLPPADAAGPLAHTGTGYGLTGLRERAALCRGTLTAEPEDGQWRVLLTLPA